MQNITNNSQYVRSIIYYCARCCVILAILPACCLFELAALGQHELRSSVHQDPEQLALNIKYDKQKQDEDNIRIQELTVEAFRQEARKIRRNLEALSFTPSSEMTPHLKQYAAHLSTELIKVEQHIEAVNRNLDIQRNLLDTEKVNIQMEEDRRRQWGPAKQQEPADSLSGKWADDMRDSNQKRMNGIAQGRADIDTQNARLVALVSGDLAPYPATQAIGNALPNTNGAHETAELDLCQMLESKATANDYDIAEINLLAAKGLPGAENLDIEKTLKTLDLWAAWVKHETDRHLHAYKNAPEEFNHSEGYFRMLMLVCTLQEDFRVCYNKDPGMRAGPTEIAPDDFTFFGNPMDLFVHGVTEGEHQGTCASLPVLYVAVGRRLGYPLKLVEGKGHLFVRWEDDKERFNIEGTSRGLNCFPDQEYMEWPWPISKEELDTGMYMKSLTPKREVAAFLELRALCLMQHKRPVQHFTSKLYADNLRRKEGVDLDTVNRLMRRYVSQHSTDGTVESALTHQIMTNTNSWRAAGNERGGPVKHTVFATERFTTE